jgi:hypothetical protein
MTGKPAAAHSRARPEPRSPVPPMTAIVGLFCMCLPNQSPAAQDHYGTMFRNTIPLAFKLISSRFLPFHAAPIGNAERHHLD